MSSTNHTTNYNLPQWVGTDKPAWLGDMNPAFTAIDTQMKANNTLAQQGVTDASTADGKAVNAQADATQALLDASTAQGTANDAVATANIVAGQVTALNNKIQLTNFTTTNYSTTTGEDIRFTLAQNSDGTLFKIYGYVALTNNTGSTVRPWSARTTTVTVDNVSYSCIDLGLTLSSAPDAPYIISPVGFVSMETPNTPKVDGTLNLVVIVDGNGKLYLNYWGFDGLASGKRASIRLMPCLYFNGDFGDLPQPE